MDKKLYTRLKELVLPLLSPELELYDLSLHQEGKDLILSILIDKKGGVDLDCCVALSEKISLALDKEDPIDSEYILEVASAGAEKALINSEQWQAAIDQYILVQVQEKVAGYDELVGYLRDVDAETISLEIKIKTQVKEVVISRSNITAARTCVKL
ncbi:ribosome maturation factor RimP [bacterium]|nr:ribosome maturation factor RimP [bacterium]